MELVADIDALRSALAGADTVALVPTMGNLHDGHLALVREARRIAGPQARIVASIFVNRLQFGGGEDFERYPRTFERDRAMLEANDCDLLFAPDESVMYPQPQRFFVEPDPALAPLLEGAARGGHFRGVCTVVLKLFSIVQPQLAVFGKKDYQQLMLIRRMVEQFALPIRIAGLDTVRETDGLAMSSRNGYLDAAQRREAPRLHRVLSQVADALRSGRGGDLAALEADAQAELARHGWQPDYVSVRQRSDLLPPPRTGTEQAAPAPQAQAQPLVVLGAARLGATRLIDNLEI